MSMISEQVKELRTIANNLTIGHNMSISIAIERFREAADTIESLSAKLAKENMERSSRYYGELGFIKVTEEVKEELIEQHNKAFELINKIPLKGNEVLIGYAGGVMQTLGYLIDNIELPEPYKPD